ncbi:unnamed protein product [Lota lota]
MSAWSVVVARAGLQGNGTKTPWLSEPETPERGEEGAGTTEIQREVRRRGNPFGLRPSGSSFAKTSTLKPHPSRLHLWGFAEDERHGPTQCSAGRYSGGGAVDDGGGGIRAAMPPLKSHRPQMDSGGG